MLKLQSHFCLLSILKFELYALYRQEYFYEDFELIKDGRGMGKQVNDIMKQQHARERMNGK